MIPARIAKSSKASLGARWRQATDCLDRLRRERRAVVALEFALLAIPAMGLLVGLLVIATDLYLQEVLDYSTQRAVRQVQIGSIATGTTAATFINTNFCSILSPFLPLVPCANGTTVTIDMQAVTNYFNNGLPIAPAQANSCFNVGTPGQLMYVKVYYLRPSALVLPFVKANTTASGKYIISNAAFENENPTGAAVAAPSGTGC